MLSMSTITAMFEGNRAEAREVFESIRTADYISPEERESKPRGKRVKRYHFKSRCLKSA